MAPSYHLIEISKIWCSKFRGGGHAPLAHTLNLSLENICNVNGFQSTIFKLLPGSCFNDLNGNYVESRNVCKVKFNGKAPTFLTVGNFRKCMVITLVIHFSSSLLEHAQQKWKYQICPRTAKTVKSYNYNINILPKQNDKQSIT